MLVDRVASLIWSEISKTKLGWSSQNLMYGWSPMYHFYPFFGVMVFGDCNFSIYNHLLYQIELCLQTVYSQRCWVVCWVVRLVFRSLLVVARFSLQDVNGQLSPELGRLYSLKRLDLGGADGLTGSIEALRNATLLQELNLSHCQVPRYDVAVWNRVFFSWKNANMLQQPACYVMLMSCCDFWIAIVFLSFTY